jgi:hypothetical protein
MNIMKKTLLASAVSAAALLAASAASATNYDIVNGSYLGDGVSLSGMINGAAAPSSEIAAIIVLQTNTGQVLPTFCVDLFHTISPGSMYTYTSGMLQYDSSFPSQPAGVSGNMIGQPQTGAIQTLANMGATDWAAGDRNPDDYAGIQGAIWQLEYNGVNGNTLSVTGSPTVTALIASDEAYAMANPASYANTIFPGTDGQALAAGNGQALTEAPGPNMGQGLLGFAAMTALLIGARYRGLFV